ncbi:Mitochondrial genome maintenance protein MGM101 [Candida tropicalis]
MLNPIKYSLSRVPLTRYYVTATTKASSTVTRSYNRSYKRASPVVKPKAVTTPKEEFEVEQEGEEENDIIGTGNESGSHGSALFHDSPLEAPLFNNNNGTINWSDSFHGLGSQPFSREIADILLTPIDAKDIEIKPDGLLYLPEIKYRRVLNRAFGPGGWGLAPRTETFITPTQISREYGLICHGRLVSIARGEQDYFGGEDKITTALEGCKSNALMRCCKDLGIASELWDPAFVRAWKKKYCEEIFVEHATKKTKKKLWRLKTNKEIPYPFKAI